MVHHLTSTSPERPAPWPRMGVYRLPPDTHGITAGWMVPSRGTPGAFRLVIWNRDGEGIFFTCSCPRGEELGRMSGKPGGQCHHVQLAAEADRADGLAKRPIAPPNISALVD